MNSEQYFFHWFWKMSQFHRFISELIKNIVVQTQNRYGPGLKITFFDLSDHNESMDPKKSKTNFERLLKASIRKPKSEILFLFVDQLAEDSIRIKTLRIKTKIVFLSLSPLSHDPNHKYIYLFEIWWFLSWKSLPVWLSGISWPVYWIKNDCSCFKGIFGLFIWGEKGTPWTRGYVL